MLQSARTKTGLAPASKSKAMNNTQSSKSRIPVPNMANKKSVKINKASVVPDFDKLHKKWQDKLQRGKACTKKSCTLVEAFPMSHPEAKRRIQDRENIDPVMTGPYRFEEDFAIDQEALNSIVTNKGIEHTTRRATLAGWQHQTVRTKSKNVVKRKILGDLAADNRQTSIRSKTSDVQQEIGEDFHFESDPQALQSILENTGIEELPRTTHNPPVSHRQTIATTTTGAYLTPRKETRHSIYQKPSRTGGLQAAVEDLKRLTLSKQTTKTPGCEAVEAENIFTAQRMVRDRNSIYLSRVKKPHHHTTVRAKTPGTARRMAVCPTSTRHRHRHPGQSPAMRMSTATKRSVKWADVLSPQTPGPSTILTSSNQKDILATTLDFASPEPRQNVSPNTSPDEDDLRQLKEIEEAERLLEEEIRQMELAKYEPVEQSQADQQQWPAVQSKVSGIVKVPDKIVHEVFPPDFIPKKSKMVDKETTSPGRVVGLEYIDKTPQCPRLANIPSVLYCDKTPTQPSLTYDYVNPLSHSKTPELNMMIPSSLLLDKTPVAPECEYLVEQPVAPSIELDYNDRDDTLQLETNDMNLEDLDVLGSPVKSAVFPKQTNRKSILDLNQSLSESIHEYALLENRAKQLRTLAESKQRNTVCEVTSLSKGRNTDCDVTGMSTGRNDNGSGGNQNDTTAVVFKEDFITTSVSNQSDILRQLEEIQQHQEKLIGLQNQLQEQLKVQQTLASTGHVTNVKYPDQLLSGLEVKYTTKSQIEKQNLGSAPEDDAVPQSKEQCSGGTNVLDTFDCLFQHSPLDLTRQKTKRRSAFGMVATKTAALGVNTSTHDIMDLSICNVPPITPPASFGPLFPEHITDEILGQRSQANRMRSITHVTTSNNVPITSTLSQESALSLQITIPSNAGITSPLLDITNIDTNVGSKQSMNFFDSVIHKPQIVAQSEVSGHPYPETPLPTPLYLRRSTCTPIPLMPHLDHSHSAINSSVRLQPLKFSPQLGLGSSQGLSPFGGMTKDSGQFGSPMGKPWRSPGEIKTQAANTCTPTSALQRLHDALLDEEVALYTCRLHTMFTPMSSVERDIRNPVANTLDNGDHMHFIPITTEEGSRNHWKPKQGSAFQRWAP